MRSQANMKSAPEVASNPLTSVENITPTRSSRRSSVDKRGSSQLINSQCANSIRSMSTTVSQSDNPNAMEISNKPFKEFYEVEKVIGRGLFGSVKRCRCLKTNELYAAKFLRKQYKGKDHRAHLMKEVSMLQKVVDHPNIVHIVELYETNHELIIVTEYASGGELHSFIDDEEGLSEEKTIKILRQLLEALVFIHDMNIVHLDLKPQNILLTGEPSDVNIKLCDFGSAILITEDAEARQIAGTENYVPPEVLSYDPIHTASDMWTVGVVTYITLTGHFPFAGDSKQETFLNISQRNLDFPEALFADISQEAQDFISDLCVLNPNKRPTAQDCLQHPWLKLSPSTKLSPSVTSSPICHHRSPATTVGSPPGVRRTLSPPSPGTTLEEPTKKCRCDPNMNGNDHEANGDNGMVLSKERLDNGSAAMINNRGCDTLTVNGNPVTSVVRLENIQNNNTDMNTVTNSTASINSTTSTNSSSSSSKESSVNQSRRDSVRMKIKNYERQLVCTS